ncbi:MAG: hypothetical protein ABS944_04935 [Solibacillus sp.]|uniref:hypothetical protein n=1 Tax=unclassified Solibacillus TaxID=2637870 RepID=UPI0030F7EE22
MRKNYNPYLLPPWLRKFRFLMKGCIIPLAIFQGIRTIFFPTSGDIILFILLIILCYLLSIDFI